MVLKPVHTCTALLLGSLLAACNSATTPVQSKDTTAPAVTLSAAPNPVTSAGTLTLTAAATDDGGVARVEFYEGATRLGADTTAPFTQTTTLNAVLNGNHTYTAVAFDAAGNKASASTTVAVNIAAATAPLRVTVTDQNIGAPVSGSAVSVYQNGTLLGTVTTDATGQLTLSGLSAGTYDLQARKPGMAGSDIHGVVVGTQTPAVTLVQRPAFDTSATTTPAKLELTRADGTPLAGATFTDQLDFRIKTATDSDHVGPLRIVYAQLNRTPGSASVTGSTTASSWSYAPPQDQLGVTDSGAVTTTGTFTAGFGTPSGEALVLEILAVDYNYNYARYSVPITLISTNAAARNTVVAPTAAAATAFTLKQEGAWTTRRAGARHGRRAERLGRLRGSPLVLHGHHAHRQTVRL
ncbi:carboxypeptidase regulatory-like domain-containing protein (plasmid) [Deinococcus taeanensis]|uniref:Ig-like domain-containing protein n=1 Tax=Deinococcus taeanensis TaxID=2737050 RepID=UPI001CDBD4DF|nr:Ig-like domain-containing protein [Deinococcus taeanensis]UBV44854.1 carboxypeptidase regulatory-like domain-containing protein [Deinococcus taeanensis]